MNLSVSGQKGWEDVLKATFSVSREKWGMVDQEIEFLLQQLVSYYKGAAQFATSCTFDEAPPSVRLSGLQLQPYKGWVGTVPW